MLVSVCVGSWLGIKHRTLSMLDMLYHQVTRLYPSRNLWFLIIFETEEYHVYGTLVLWE